MYFNNSEITNSTRERVHFLLITIEAKRNKPSILQKKKIFRNERLFYNNYYNNDTYYGTRRVQQQ